MTWTLQGSLLDLAEACSFAPFAPGLERLPLQHGAWVDVRRGWLQGADSLLERLLREVPWRAERRQMYDSVVDVPRMTAFYATDEPLPDLVLTQAREGLSDHYQPELGERFATAGLCLYRDGRDSVAWHGDRFGRSSTQDTMVAILSLGSPRPLHLRPRDKGPTALRLPLGHGDLVVMGGTCQRTWDHAIPKTSAAVGPRVSVQFRAAGVR
ncbi:MAG: alpha-ketoglutarate-dependent dioxygenase AlkB [Actinomycetota bacterium]|nr:alpha-ketoglutarate-dependent dioxygenase AlkB [Actinomycetota bacterium]